MGRRSRRRHGQQAEAPPKPEPSRQGRSERPPTERPPPPWGSFPLTELAVFVAIVGAVVGWLVGGTAGIAVVGGAFFLGSLAGLELAAREHFAGYRSHTSLLAGLIAFVVLAALFVAVPATAFGPAYRLAIAAAVFAAVFPPLRRAFKRRSGGAGFR